jgi:pimeloyl-ACP methyl ester carboxylesterase
VDAWSSRGSSVGAPIILVPGFWLGAWAWDEVVAALRADGHHVTAVTLPGLESPDADRSAISLSDHVDAICEAVLATEALVVLAVHSGAGGAGYAASDRLDERIAAMVYVDSAPASAAFDPDFEGVEKPLPSPEELQGGRTSTGSTPNSWRPFVGGRSPNRVASCARPPFS